MTEAVTRYLWRMLLYNIVWFAGFCWFFGFLGFMSGKFAGAGPLTFFIALAIASAPIGMLWAGKRWVTGRWIS